MKTKKFFKYLILVPSVIFVFIFFVYPFINAIFIAFKSGRGSQLTYSGFENFFKMINDAVFKQAFSNTLLFAIIQTPIMLILALIISLCLNKTNSKTRSVFITILFIPVVISPVVYSLFFKYVFSNNGILNNILIQLNLLDNGINWFLYENYSRLIIIIACTWAWTGYYVILFSSALQRIDKNLIDAARLDGVSSVKIFFKIKLAKLFPVILFSSLIAFCGALQIYAESTLITGGKPGYSTMSLVQYIYNLSFVYIPQFGYASLLSVVLFVICISFLIIQLIVSRRYEKNNN